MKKLVMISSSMNALVQKGSLPEAAAGKIIRQAKKKSLLHNFPPKLRV